MEKKMGRPPVAASEKLEQASVGLPSKKLDEMLEEADLQGMAISSFLRPLVEEGWDLYRTLGREKFLARRRKKKG